MASCHRLPNDLKRGAFTACHAMIQDIKTIEIQ
jgi:hypothetical protein